MAPRGFVEAMVCSLGRWRGVRADGHAQHGRTNCVHVDNARCRAALPQTTRSITADMRDERSDCAGDRPRKREGPRRYQIPCVTFTAHELAAQDAPALADQATRRPPDADAAHFTSGNNGRSEGIVLSIVLCDHVERRCVEIGRHEPHDSPYSGLSH